MHVTLVSRVIFVTTTNMSSCLHDEDVWDFWDIYLQLIAPNNLWNKCIDLRLLSKCLEGSFLRPLRSKDVWGWILKLQPRNVLGSSESLTANLEKVRQTSVWQMVPKFWFIWLWYLSSLLRNYQIWYQNFTTTWTKH